MRRQGGASKFELSVVVAIIGLVALVGLDRFRDVQELAEKTLVESTVRNMQSELLVALAGRIIGGQENRIAEMIGSNPVSWMEVPPAGYVGEVNSLPELLAPGAWCFDTTRRELAYRARQDRNLTLAAGEVLLRWRIVPSGKPAESGRVDWVKLTPVVPYRWF